MRDDIYCVAIGKSCPWLYFFDGKRAAADFVRAMTCVTNLTLTWRSLSTRNVVTGGPAATPIDALREFIEGDWTNMTMHVGELDLWYVIGKAEMI